MKRHDWTDDDDSKLLAAVNDCKPIFQHFKEQGSSYSDGNAWDAVAGRLLPDVCVTGAACRKRFEKILKPVSDGWKDTADAVAAYERDLAETMFDGVAELLGNVDALLERMDSVGKRIDEVSGRLDVLVKAFE